MVLFSDDLFKGNTGLQQQVHETIRAHKRLLNQALKEGQEAGQIRTDVDAEHLFLVTMGALRLLVNQWKLSGFNFDLETRGQDLWDSIETLLRV